MGDKADVSKSIRRYLGESPPRNNAEEYKKALDSSSQQTRNLLVSFTLILFYLLVTVSATTHRDLLIPDSKITLPLLNIKISLLDFYFVAPVLIFIFHLNLLFNLRKHAQKYQAWKEKDPEGDEALLFQFIFNYTHTSKWWGVTGMALRFITWAVAYAGPLFLLALIQYKFLPYHHVFTSIELVQKFCQKHYIGLTTWHQIAVALDSFFIAFFWFRIRNPGSKWSWVRKPPDEKTMKAIPAVHIMITTAIAVELITFSFYFAVIPEKWGETAFGIAIDDLIERNINLSRQTLVAEDAPVEIVAAYIREGKTKEQAFTNFGKGLDLQGRDLRFANFFHSNLSKANLSIAQLQGAMLIGAQLQGADLSRARLEGAMLIGAQLRGADLNRARLEGVMLIGAQLQGADLSRARLEGAMLARSQLQGADLSEALLHGAILSEAQLQGADFTGAKTEGVLAEKIDWETPVDWDKLIVEGKPIIQDKKRQDKFVERIEKAKSEIGEKQDRLEFDNDFGKFMKWRKKLACKDSMITRDLLLRNIGDWDKEHDKILTEHIKAKCPEIWEELQEARKR